MTGQWEDHDPFAITHRLNATVDMYHGPGGCSAFRSYQVNPPQGLEEFKSNNWTDQDSQGWLSLSDCSPGAGTLRVMPHLLSSSAYTLLRPFVHQDPQTDRWTLDDKTSTFHGAAMGAGQELLATEHPHIYSNGFVSIPRVQPGDAVFWHCDVAHMVENQHRGTEDSSVLYIPAAPLCEVNARYLKSQRESFLEGRPPPDFPGELGREILKSGGWWMGCLIRESGQWGVWGLK